MASSETLIRLPHTLLTIPVEIQTYIMGHLDIPGLQTLRLSCNYFYIIIPPPVHADLVAIEASLQGNIDYFACVGCTTIRPRAMFSPSMLKKKKTSGGSQACNRFCNECGRRPLPGLHRWTMGIRWEEDDTRGSYVPFVRCLGCERIARAPADKAIRLCLGCHTYDIERVRAAEEVQRVQKEFNDREERRRMREDRRIQWIASGYAASDFSQHDPGSEGEEEYWWGDNPNDWLEDDAMNYSGCS